MTHPTRDVRIVPLDSGVFEVHLETTAGRIRIGKVSNRDDRRSWAWEHRDGERSSPVATNLGEAVDALAHYHRCFKTRPGASPRARTPRG